MSYIFIKMRVDSDLEEAVKDLYIINDSLRKGLEQRDYTLEVDAWIEEISVQEEHKIYNYEERIGKEKEVK